jgi:YHS domain-containing protein
MGWIIRLLLLAFAVFLIISGVRRLLLPTSLPRRDKRKEKGQEEGALMIQDPQCGRFIFEKEALKTSFQGQIVYFCSQECRDLYTRR